MQLEGTVLCGRDFEPVQGRVVVEDGRIVAVEETDTDSDDVILPAFVNAHTHLGDSIAKDAGEGLSLDDLVAPPDGLKHRLLREASREELVAAMRRSVRLMAATGTAAFLDFREGGVEGVYALREAADGLDVEALVLGRDGLDALGAGDGYGASGARHGDFSGERNAARRDGKLFAIHAGERDGADVNPALDLDPDLLVHMVHADDLHLDRVADRDIPVAVCPRSNVVTGVGLPPIRELLDRTTVALGTDNVFLNGPSMFREMAFAETCCDVTAPEVLRMATVAGAEIAGLDCGIVEEDRPAKLLVLDGDSDNLAGSQDLVRSVVRRAGAADVKEVVL